MHKSRLSTIVMDCQTEQLDEATNFWAKALGWRARVPEEPINANYRKLETPSSQINILVQSVTHASRAHVDIETNDVEAEVRRLEALGARRMEKVRQWWILEAPTGQRFCVVPPQRSDFELQANVWTSVTTK